MEYILALATFILGISASFWGIGMDINSAKYFAILFLIIGFILLLIPITDKLRKKLWSNKKWKAMTSYHISGLENNPQNAITHDFGGWRSSSPQERLNWFSVDFGKKRLISSIELETDQYLLEKPDRWTMTLYGENPNYGLEDKHGECFIYHSRGRKAVPIQSFKVWIDEPAQEMSPESNYAKVYKTTKIHWTVSSLEIKEYRFRFLGKGFWEHEIN